MSSADMPRSPGLTGPALTASNAPAVAPNSAAVASARKGLTAAHHERDSCGFGLIASLDDKPSHWLIETAITSLNRLTHRGAIATDGNTGDGCGLLLRRPDAFLRAVAAEAGIELTARFASGLVFLSREPALADAARTCLEAQLSRQGLATAGWRSLPINPDAC